MIESRICTVKIPAAWGWKECCEAGIFREARIVEQALEFENLNPIHIDYNIPHVRINLRLKTNAEAALIRAAMRVACEKMKKMMECI